MSGVRFGTTEPAVGLATREAQLGRKYDGFHDYGGGDFSFGTVKHADHYQFRTVSSGAHKKLPQKMWVQDTNAGKLDAAIEAYRDKIAQPTLVAIWQEMNGAWQWTNAKYVGGAANFAKAFRRAALLLKQNPLIEVGWSPNAYGFAGSSAEDPKAYYPGADVVDAVVVDGYCRGTYHDFKTIFGPAIGHYGPNGTRAKHKFVVGETGAQKALRPDRYVNSVHSYLTANPGQVAEVYWFDNPWDTDGYNLDATQAELAAMKAMVNDPLLVAA
jgi:hypothetical protein